MPNVSEYFNIKKGKQSGEQPKSPLLNEQDEEFLNRITSEEEPPPLPKRPVTVASDGQTLQGRDAQTALMDGADVVPLPMSPPEEDSAKDAEVHKSGKDYWADIKSKVPNLPNLPNLSSFSKGKAKETTASDLLSAAHVVKTGEGAYTPEQVEAKKEEDELTSVLDQLNLSAVNNRVFSFSKESTKLMDEFTLILKDLVNGVPTAYDDLERLLKREEGQLNKLFGAMPPFLQNLVKSLPAKMTAGLGPEFMATMSENPIKAGRMAHAKVRSTVAEGKKPRIPSLKALVSTQGVVATMLRSILNFLKLRFPVLLTGTNVLMSLAVFLLLFVFWYCHKRGKQVRLSKEGQEVEVESDVEGSEVLEESSKEVQSPLESNDNPSTGEKPAVVLEDILTEPAPEAVLRPEPKGEKELALPVEAAK